MKKQTLVVSAVLGGLFVWAAGPLVSQEEAGDPMEMWMKANEMGEHHQHLADSVGNWDVAGRFWSAPGEPPTETKGSSTIQLLHGGRYVKDEFSSEWMGVPFTGTAITGYDNVKQKYVSIWFDSMSTGFMIAEGTCLDGGRRVEMIGEYQDPMTGGAKKTRMVIRVDGPDKKSEEMFETGADGKEVKTMELIYTRGK